MTHTFLVEIGLEEIPAHVVTPSAQQLTERVSSFLREKRLSFENIETFSTPRRLAVKVLNLADQQANIEEEAKGPAKKLHKMPKEIGLRQQLVFPVVKE